MLKKGFFLVLIFFITISCFNNKIKEIKDFSFEKLKTTQTSSQVNSNYLEGVSPIDLEVFLLEKNFQKINNQENSDKDISLKQFIFSETEANYKIVINGNEKIKKIEFYSKSETNPLGSAKVFFTKASKIPIPQIDTLRIKKWTEHNINLITEKFSKATILANIHYIIEQLSSSEYRLTIKKYQG